MTKHTPEPWYSTSISGGRMYVSSDAQPESTFGTICDFYCRNDTPQGFYVFPNAEANASRIVACVNALAGINDPAAFVERAKRMEAELRRASLILMGCVGVNDQNEAERAEAIKQIRSALNPGGAACPQ